MGGGVYKRRRLQFFYWHKYNNGCKPTRIVIYYKLPNNFIAVNGIIFLLANTLLIGIFVSYFSKVLCWLYAVYKKY